MIEDADNSFPEYLIRIIWNSLKCRHGKQSHTHVGAIWKKKYGKTNNRMLEYR